MAWFWDAYAPHTEDRKKTTASPLSATLEQLKSLPPALVIVDENDVLRDEDAMRRACEHVCGLTAGCPASSASRSRAEYA
jgi:acetyl esterase/lipase